ncbi:MAG: ATP-dependent DNA helicase RecG [Oscillospiraceae bacterium]|nr:ATP-dependent DNA helicase RecG [Oscillospiraceae bacterium]
MMKNNVKDSGAGGAKNASVPEGSIRYLKGVGEAREKLFLKLGIRTLRDLICYFPRGYEDRTVFRKLSAFTVGESACVCAIVAETPRLSHIRKGLDITKLRAADETGSVEITFFNMPFVKDALKQGESYVFYGKNSGTLLQPQMTNPIFERMRGELWSKPASMSAAGSKVGCIAPKYPLTARLSSAIIATAVRSALEKCRDVLPDVIPYDVAAQFGLCKAKWAYENIHFPTSFTELSIARRRLIFEELFVLVTAMRFLREKRDTQLGIRIDVPDLREFYKALPFAPTGAQTRAIGDVLTDMSSGRLMNRLIQGDVGSGKTIVAAAAAWAAWYCGAQSAFMAPTEILAKQHHRTLSRLLSPFGMRVGLLTGSMTAKGKHEAYERLRYGETDLIIGTHALLSEGVVFKNPALVITDEQHRFGVQQREVLSAKGENAHVLVMSATPIPRTLALFIYGDLDISIIDEMPPGRREIETHVVNEAYRERLYAFVRKLIGEGRQAYIICPMVEESEYDASDEAADPHSSGFASGTADSHASNPAPRAALKSAREYHEILSTKIFPDFNIALAHGKMPAKQKDAAMAAFSSGKADILVATTVVEVGVDIPNAALIIIENAERFGLSQLHQLRGRVGRGEHKSYCVLCVGSAAADGKERLQIMKSTNDGFIIAEEDLKLRGPGDFFGSRQHGLPQMRIANLASDMLVLRDAGQAAEKLLQIDPDLSFPEHRPLADQIKRIFENHANTLN